MKEKNKRQYKFNEGDLWTYIDRVNKWMDFIPNKPRVSQEIDIR